MRRTYSALAILAALWVSACGREPAGGGTEGVPPTTASDRLYIQTAGMVKSLGIT